MAKINYDGTNIVGGPFKPYVDKQTKVRQEKLGNFNKTSEEIAWENGKSAFVALASSVDVRNTVLSETQYFKDANFFNFTSNDRSFKPEEVDFFDSELIKAAGGEISQSITTTILTDGEERIKLLDLAGDPQQYFGNFLARNIVLYGGTSYFTPDSDGFLNGPNYRFGITKKDNVFDDSAYGFGGTNPDGFKPMPGITSFNLKSKNMGSLRDATITLRANSEEQFKIIDNLYCRIGYTMFLEWGNSLYFDNEGKYKRDSTSSMIPMFLSGKIIEDGVEIDLTKDPTSFISRIEAKREESNGNYDAFFGRVKNFSWEFIAKGGYYEITLSLISWGDIIESLTIDGQYGNTNEETDDKEVQRNNNSALTSFLNTAAEPTSELIVEESSDGYFYKRSETDITAVFKTTLIAEREEIKKTTINIQVGPLEKALAGLDDDELEDLLNREATIDYQDPSDTSTKLGYTRLPTSVARIISGHAQFGNEHYYYIRFGDILDFIRDRLLLYSNSKAIVDIDTDTLKNICYSPGINVSADPSRVMVNNPLPFNLSQLRTLARRQSLPPTDEPDWDEDRLRQSSIFRQPDAKLENFESKSNPNGSGDDFPLHGKIMNIYFEYQWLLTTIEGLRDEDTTKIPLFDFIDRLCKAANECLGGVNKLSIRLEEDRIMRIYDQTPIYGTQVPDNEGTTINLFGFKPKDTSISGSLTHGSFVTDVNIKTELTNEFSTTVSVGAQAQGSVVGEDSTGLSKWNFGLQDRYYPFKVDSLKKDNKEEEITTERRIEKITDQLKFLWFYYAEGARYIVTIDGVKQVGLYYFEHFNNNSVFDFVKLQKDWLSEIIKLENELENKKRIAKGSQTFGTNQIGMIPINIQVTMDGLSGIRIYDRLKLDTRFLPNYYPQTLYWVIKGVSHEVVDNKWYTKLETIAVPKLPESQDLIGTIGGGTDTGDLGRILGSLSNNLYQPEVNKFSTNTTLSKFAETVNNTLGDEYSDSIKASVIFLALQEQNLKGFNYNYYGVQTDIKWSGLEPYINGSFNSTEGSAGQGDRIADTRWFASFKSEADGIKFVAYKLKSKGWGGISTSPNNISDAEYIEQVSKKYYGTWLFGNPDSTKVAGLVAKDAGIGGEKRNLWEEAYQALLSVQPDDNNEDGNDGDNTEIYGPSPSRDSEENNVDGYEDRTFEDGNTTIDIGPQYIRNGKLLSKEEWINAVNQATQEELNTGQWGVENDDETLQILIDKLQS